MFISTFINPSSMFVSFPTSESEAWSVRQQLTSEQSQLSLVLGSSSTTSQPESASLQSPETLSSPDQVFTPGSSGVSAQSFDFSTAAICGAGEDQQQQQQAGVSKAATQEEATSVGAEGARSSLSSLEEESLFQPTAAASTTTPIITTEGDSGSGISLVEPLVSPSAASSPIPVTVATVPELDFLTQNILLPPSFQLEPPLPALPLPLPPVPTSQAQQQQQQTKELVCTPPYTPQVTSGGSFPFGDPLFSFDSGTDATMPSLAALTGTITTTTASQQQSSSPGGNNAPSSTPPPPTTTLSSLLPLTLNLNLTPATTELLFPGEPCSGTLYEKLPPTPDSPGDGDCTIMNLPEVRGPLYVDVPLGPLHCHPPPEGLLTPEASPGKQSYLSFFSLEPELEREKMDIALLAEHIGTLAEGLYPDPLISKLVAACPPSSNANANAANSEQQPSFTDSNANLTMDPVGLDNLFSLLGDFYPIKSWRGLDLPIFPDEDSLFEERALESLLQDLAATTTSTSSPCPSPSPSSSSSLTTITPTSSTLSSPTSYSPAPLSSSFSSSSSTSPCSTPSSSLMSPTSPMCWDALPSSLHVDASHFRSVQSAHRIQASGCGGAVTLTTTMTPVAVETMECGMPTSPGDWDDMNNNNIDEEEQHEVEMELEAEVSMETDEDEDEDKDKLSPLLSSGAPMSPPSPALVPSTLSVSTASSSNLDLLPPVSPVVAAHHQHHLHLHHHHPAQPGLPCAQSLLLEELATLEPMFGAGASITPSLGHQTELYQLQCHPMPQCFHKGELA